MSQPSTGDACQLKPGRWGLYIHHHCTAHQFDAVPEYILGTFESRDQTLEAAK